jgi:hypothetical protein
MRKIFCFILFTACCIYAQAQGCVAIRSNGGTCTMTDHNEEGHTNAKSWMFGINTRYFKSYKHFIGTEEQPGRVEQGTEVINHSFSTELAFTRTVTNRWSFAFYIPVINNIRSSMYEHYGNTSKSANARRNTHAFGLGDIRVAAYYWLTDPAKKSKLIVQTGLGLKLPTGDYKVQDYFFKNDSTKVLGPVDQSIQLGDGGTGITGELNAYYLFNRSVVAYGNGYYLLNPREQNGVSNSRGVPPTAAALANTSDVMSVPDQYMFRVGVSAMVRHFSFSGGMRMECVPAKDLVGGSHGFRRPGYVISAEPVVAYKLTRSQFYISIPWAVERNRTQSVPDKIRTQMTGVYTHGDAAFADYSVNIGASFSF